MHKVTIEAVGVQPLERPFARGNRSIARGVVRQHLGDEENLIAPPGDRRADQFLGCARTVHLRGVDMGHAEIEALAQRGDRRRRIRLLDIPGALADDGHIAPGRAERPPLHGSRRALYGVRRHGAARRRP